MKTKSFITLHLLLSVIVFTACTISNVGTQVPVDKRIPLQAGQEQSGVWKAFEYTMNYRYRLDRLNVQAPGKISISGTIERGGISLANLNIWVNFLDHGGRVLEQKSVFMAGFRSSEVDPSFTVELDTPPGSIAMSFSHTAQQQRGRNR